MVRRSWEGLLPTGEAGAPRTYLHVASVQELEQAPGPVCVHRQSLVHSSRVQLPVWEQLMVQPLPAQESVTLPEPLVVTVHPPCGHLNVQLPRPEH